jgi:ankyrin repeat protein
MYFIGIQVGNTPFDYARGKIRGWIQFPLHFAALIGDVAKCRAAVAGGCNINQLGKAGWTPLQFACMRGNVDAAVFLLVKGADNKKKSMLSSELYKLGVGLQETA